MTPRIAGLLGMVVALAVSVLAGIMIAHPPTSIVGALVLVGGTILFAISTGWLYRKSWSPEDWPDATISPLKAYRRLRILAVIQSVLTPLMFGGAVWLIAGGEYYAIVYLAMAILNLFSALRLLRAARRALDTAEQSNSPETSPPPHTATGHGHRAQS